MLTVYQGLRRTDTHWKPHSYEWDKFVDRLRNPARTSETVAEYQKMSRDDKGKAKDVGGFVGGALRNGERKKGSVQMRSMLSLDADNANMGLLDSFRALGYAGVVYSTHSHTSAAPKLRLIIPLATPIYASMYPALINYFACLLGVEQFDPTTDEAHRLMYWPSCPQDGEYVFEEFKGGHVDGTALMELHPEWLDASMWVLSEKKRKSHIGADKAEDPRTKKGIVGAFCRVYDIRAAIDTFLPDVYVGGSEGRYTYVDGSTGNGVVVYEETWTYSHHATDPCGGRLCNAWDLVRIHLYGKLDEKVSENTAIYSLPSHLAMTELVGELPDVVQEVAMAAMAEASAVFGEDDREWLRKLTLDRKGFISDTIKNCLTIILNDANLRGGIKYNELKDRIFASPMLPWRNGVGGSWSDADVSRLFMYFEENYHLTNRSSIAAALSGSMFDNRFHPVRDYLDGLEWDGVARIDTMLIDYLGAEDNEYTRAATRKWMCGAVARAMTPGIQFDHMLLLVGPQGTKKTTLLRTLCGEEWFTDSLNSLSSGKDSAEQVKGYWVVCMDELSAIKKSSEEQEQIKNFLTRKVDSFRPAYGHYVLDNPRQCVFCGTTNEDTFLKDPTGSRRFWPVRVDGMNEERWKTFNRDQLWAEAVTYFRLDEQLYFDDDMAKLAQNIQASYTEEESLVGIVTDFISTPIPKNYYEWTPAEQSIWYHEGAAGGTEIRSVISAIEIHCVLNKGQLTDFPRKKQYELNNVLRGMKDLLESRGKSCRYPSYGKQRVWEILRNKN